MEIEERPDETSSTGFIPLLKIYFNIYREQGDDVVVMNVSLRQAAVCDDDIWSVGRYHQTDDSGKATAHNRMYPLETPDFINSAIRYFHLIRIYFQ